MPQLNLQIFLLWLKMLCRKRSESTLSEELASGWMWETCETRALGLLLRSVDVLVPGPGCSFSFHAHPVVFFEPAWLMEIGAKVSWTGSLPKSCSSLHGSYRCRVWKLPWVYAIRRGCVANAGVLPSCTHMPQCQGHQCPPFAVFWTLQSSSRGHGKTSALCVKLHPRGHSNRYTRIPVPEKQHCSYLFFFLYDNFGLFFSLRKANNLQSPVL